MGALYWLCKYNICYTILGKPAIHLEGLQKYVLLGLLAFLDLFAAPPIVILHTIFEKNQAVLLPSLQEQAFLLSCIVILIQCKIYMIIVILLSIY